MRGRSLYKYAPGIGLLVLGLLLGSTAYGQEIRAQKMVVASGGGTATNGTTTMSYTIGQPAVGVATNGTMTGTFGFWTSIPQVSSVEDVTEVGGVRLVNVTPNPVVDGEGSVELEIASAGEVKVDLYNAVGQRVLMLHDGITEAGPFVVDFSTSDLAAGVYYIAIRVPGGMLQESISIIK